MLCTRGPHHRDQPLSAEVYTVAHLSEWLDDAGPRSKLRKFILRRLQIAEAYEAAEAEARNRSGLAAAIAERKEVRERLEAAAKAIVERPALTPEGLMFKPAVFSAIRCVWLGSDMWLFAVAGRCLPKNVLAVLSGRLSGAASPLA